jgi:hypothetical protein
VFSTASPICPAIASSNRMSLPEIRRFGKLRTQAHDADQFFSASHGQQQLGVQGYKRPCFLPIECAHPFGGLFEIDDLSGPGTAKALGDSSPAVDANGVHRMCGIYGTQSIRLAHQHEDVRARSTNHMANTGRVMPRARTTHLRHYRLMFETPLPDPREDLEMSAPGSAPCLTLVKKYNPKEACS